MKLPAASGGVLTRCFAININEEVIAKHQKTSIVISTEGRNLLISMPFRCLTLFGMTSGELL